MASTQNQGAWQDLDQGAWQNSSATTGGWLGSMWYGNQEIVNPASIMGVDVANIQSVKGVVSV